MATCKRLSVQLLIIDPQYDFMDNPDSALPVPGANADMKRVAAMIDRIGGRLDDISVTLDSHRVLDIAHPGMWKDGNGNPPNPFTIISVDDIKARIWQPRNAQAKIPDHGGKTIGQYALSYAEQLASGGNYALMVWPEHCLIGSPGHAVQADLRTALQKWERSQFANVNFCVKGVNPWTEHYGGLLAEVPMASDPSTGLNTGLLDILSNADVVAIAGEALSHCVKATVTQVADNIGADQVKKFHLLTDCMSPVPAVSDAKGNVLVDFPAIGQAWLKEMKKRGMTLTTSVEFLA